MTDDELDEARKNEAMRRLGDLFCPGTSQEQAARWGAKLAREGWMPPDPIDAIIEQVKRSCNWSHAWGASGINIVLREAIERGRELERQGK